jgi:hypothetical protein
VADRAYLENFSEERWLVDQGSIPYKQSREGLTRCARAQCQSDCQIGRSLACVGRFDWPAGYPDKPELRMRARSLDDPSHVYAGRQVRACARGSTCDKPLGSARTDERGFATMVIDFSMARLNTASLAEFDGVIDLDGDPDVYPQLWAQTGPWIDHTYKRMLVSTRSALREVHEPRGLPVPDAEHGLLEVQPFDCDSWYAWNVTLEVWQSSGSELQRCTSCVVVYPDKAGNPSRTERRLEAWNVAPAEIALSTGEVTVVVRDADSGRLVSVYPDLAVRAGYEISLVMLPASREQLANASPLLLASTQH